MGYRVVIGDDESIIRMDLCEMLEDAGHTVVGEAADGVEALDLVRKEKPDIVLVQGDTAVVQFALEGIVNSPNGIGGLTVEGRVTKKRIDYDKRGNLNYTMYVTGTALSADVTFTLPKGSTRCSATVNSNFSSDQLTFSGELCPYRSNVYQGWTFK